MTHDERERVSEEKEEDDDDDRASQPASNTPLSVCLSSHESIMVRHNRRLSTSIVDKNESICPSYIFRTIVR
jgi:hypothetical protein